MNIATTRRTTTQNILWTEAEKKRLRTLHIEGLSINQIAHAMGKTYNQVEAQRGRMKRAGLLPASKASPVAVNGADAIGLYREDTQFCPKAEQRMIDAINEQGGFPLYRRVKLNGQDACVLTTLDPHIPHPFQLEKMARAAA